MGANQFTKGTRKRHDDGTKDKIRAELLSKRLEKYAKAKGKHVEKYRMEPAQVAAAKVLIERGKPALQAITQEIIDPWDDLTDEQMQEQLKALINSSVSVLMRILDSDPGLRAAVLAHITRLPTVVEAQQPQRSIA